MSMKRINTSKILYLDGVPAKDLFADLALCDQLATQSAKRLLDFSPEHKDPTAVYSHECGDIAYDYIVNEIQELRSNYIFFCVCVDGRRRSITVGVCPSVQYSILLTNIAKKMRINPDHLYVRDKQHNAEYNWVLPDGKAYTVGEFAEACGFPGGRRSLDDAPIPFLLKCYIKSPDGVTKRKRKRKLPVISLKRGTSSTVTFKMGLSFWNTDLYTIEDMPIKTDLNYLLRELSRMMECKPTKEIYIATNEGHVYSFSEGNTDGIKVMELISETTARRDGVKYLIFWEGTRTCL